ncbi:MAG TPA: PAS domain-containing sensor histidine kinase, partial [Gemmatimonadaceae bacterium]
MTQQSSDLSESTEVRFERLVGDVRDYAIFMLDPQGRVTTWNVGAKLIKGYEAHEIIGRSFAEFYPQDQRARGWPQRELELAREHGHFEDEGWRVRKDGSLFWANVVITPLYGRDGSLVGYSKITRDLTERRHHEESLRQSEERFRLLVEGVKDYAIFLLDATGRVASWNAGAERINGYTSGEILGQHFSRFFPAEDRAKAERDLALAAFEGRTESEGWRVRKDGTRFWAATVLTALPGPDGTVRGFAKLTRDLTATRRIEALEEAGRRMTEFLAMLSHELRNPLAPIRNAVHVMHLKRLEDPELRWSRDVIERQVTHLTHLVDDLLDVTRITSGKIKLNVEPLEISVVVGRAVEASRPLLDAKGHRLDVLLPNASLIVHGDLTRLTQVVLNILNNASKFTPEGGWIPVSAAREGNEAVLRIRDNGAGIPSNMHAQIFDLFAQAAQPLDRAAGGLGIGLTLVKRLVTMHHGHVD